MYRVVLLATLLGCGGGKKAPANSGKDAEAQDVPTGFIEITMDEDEEDIFPELMKATAECGDLLSMEPKAMMGRLADAEILCLDQAIRKSERMTVKDKISRVLLKDAYAKGDMHRWEAVARRHLDEIDQSDPDICYQYARVLQQTYPPDEMEEAIRWADLALENRSRWEGDMYVGRVFTLYKIKTLASQRLWTYLEEEYMKTQDMALEERRDRARNQTKTHAREWLEYAKHSGRDTTTPMQLCVMASGTSDYCDEI